VTHGLPTSKIALAVVLLLVGACGGGGHRRCPGGIRVRCRPQRGDTARACELLAPATRSLLEYQESQPCPQAIAQRKLTSGALQGVEVWGGEAQARTNTDTWFLTRTGQGWRVAAAGCVAQGTAPYTCKVNGS
jgi:hypothetical protein